MCLYDAELLRLRADTQTDPAARHADIGAALELARRQGATLFELRAALDDFDFRGEPACRALATALSRLPADSAMPEVSRAGRCMVPAASVLKNYATRAPTELSRNRRHTSVSKLRLGDGTAI